MRVMTMVARLNASDRDFAEWLVKVDNDIPIDSSQSLQAAVDARDYHGS